MTGDDDEMFITRSLGVTPITIKQHLIVLSDKSVSCVTNNKRLRSTFYILLKLLTDTKHRAASLRQQSYLLSTIVWRNKDLYLTRPWTVPT